MIRNYKISYWFLFTVLCGFSTSAIADPFTVEGKVGIFIPSSNKMRKIFNGCLPFLELEGSYQFFPYWEACLGLGYIFAEGTSTGCGNSTSIDVVPFMLGVKRSFWISNNLDGFLGFGGLWSLYNNHDHFQSVHRHISANDFGAIAKCGVRWHWRNRLSVSFFGEYMFQRFDFRKVYPEHFTYRHDVDMSGTKIGLGMAYDF